MKRRPWWLILRRKGKMHHGVGDGGSNVNTQLCIWAYRFLLRNHAFVQCRHHQVASTWAPVYFRVGTLSSVNSLAVWHAGVLEVAHWWLWPDLPECAVLHAGGAAMGALTTEGDTVETHPCSCLLRLSWHKLPKEDFRSLEWKAEQHGWAQVDSTCLWSKCLHSSAFLASGHFVVLQAKFQIPLLVPINILVFWKIWTERLFFPGEFLF